MFSVIVSPAAALLIDRPVSGFALVLIGTGTLVAVAVLVWTIASMIIDKMKGH